jgi:hypothetical protein
MAGRDRPARSDAQSLADPAQFAQVSLVEAGEEVVSERRLEG